MDKTAAVDSTSNPYKKMHPIWLLGYNLDGDDIIYSKNTSGKVVVSIFLEILTQAER